MSFQSLSIVPGQQSSSSVPQESSTSVPQGPSSSVQQGPSPSIPQAFYKPFDESFDHAFNLLGPMPTGESEGWNPFSVHCLEKVINTLEAGNLVILADNSWSVNFIVDAIFIVTDMGPQGALLDRVWRGPDMEEMELAKATSLATEAAIKAKNLGEDGLPILPAVIEPGNFYIPKKVLLKHTTKVFALNSTGVALVRDGGMGPGYNNPVDVVPKAVKWVPSLEKASSLPVTTPAGSIQLVMPPNSYPPISYKNQQSLLALQCFKLLTGFNMELYEIVVSNLTTIDTNCAQRLSMMPHITDFMRKTPWVSNNKLLIATMSANFAIGRDLAFGQISLLDFSSTGMEWTEVGAFWHDLLSAGHVLDSLFRPGMQFFTNLFGMAYQTLNAVTVDISPSSKLAFVNTQMGLLWLRFGLFVKSQKHLLFGMEEFDSKCYSLFSFEGMDLRGLLQQVRNLNMDEVIRDHASDKAKRGRSLPDNGGLDGRHGYQGKRPGGAGGARGAGVPIPKGNTPKGFCINYYAFLAKAPHPSGGLYHDCKNKPTCKRFSHVAVSALNKEAIRDCVSDMYADLRVKAEVLKYLASF